jgi:hypothetical protein
VPSWVLSEEAALKDWKDVPERCYRVCDVKIDRWPFNTARPPHDKYLDVKYGMSVIVKKPIKTVIIPNFTIYVCLILDCLGRPGGLVYLSTSDALLGANEIKGDIWYHHGHRRKKFMQVLNSLMMISETHRIIYQISGQRMSLTLKSILGPIWCMVVPMGMFLKLI